MVSFSCEGCGDILTKKKLDPHRNRCYGATFTCIDCMVHFPGVEYRAHTSCMTEDQKYQGALYKNKKAKTNSHQQDTSEAAIAAPNPKAMNQQAYVEDVIESFADYEYEDVSDHGRSPADLPEAPTPPPAAEAVLNVFDFLDPSATPNASTLQLGPGGERANLETQMVRFDPEAHAYLDAAGTMVAEDPDALIQYGMGPIPGAYETPAPGRERKKARDGHEHKKDKKRKRLHVDTDHIMTDAPPMLHTGLTGGMNRMMRSDFPPSPDYSGGDAADPSPASPLKKKKHSKHSKSKRESGSIGSNLMGLLTSSKSKSSSKKRKVSSSSKKSSSSRRERRHSHGDADKAPKLIEYRPQSSGGEADNQMVLFRPRADLLLSYIDKGPDSERGYSMKKALRHFHRDREDSEDCLSKSGEEKELWRSLRMRKNDRGEIVLFSL